MPKLIWQKNHKSHNAREDLTPLFFLSIIMLNIILAMDSDKIKTIIENIEILLDSLKSELYSDYEKKDLVSNFNGLMDYDEVFEEYED